MEDGSSKNNPKIITKVDIDTGRIQGVDEETGDVAWHGNVPKRITKQEIKKRGYCEVTAKSVLEYIADGKTITEIGLMEDMPSRYAIYGWLRNYKQFKIEYAKARLQRAESFHDEALETARGVYHKDDVPAAKLKVDTLKWAAQVNAPEEFSGKTREDSNKQPVAIIINTGIKRPGDKDVIDVESREVKDDERE